MGKIGPRIQVGDATGTWKCRINDETLTLKDKRLIHRAIDIGFDECRRCRKQRKITAQLAVDRAKRAEAEKAAQEADAQENERAANEAADPQEPSKAVDEVATTETEKAPENS